VLKRCSYDLENLGMKSETTQYVRGITPEITYSRKMLLVSLATAENYPRIAGANGLQLPGVSNIFSRPPPPHLQFIVSPLIRKSRKGYLQDPEFLATKSGRVFVVKSMESFSAFPQGLHLNGLDRERGRTTAWTFNTNPTG
jgi:hypothetical protein